MHVKQKDEKVSSEDSRSMCVKLIGASVNLYSRANVAISYRSILSIWDQELDQPQGKGDEKSNVNASPKACVKLQ